MNGQTFNRIKNSKPFKGQDLLLYAVILIFTALLFLIPLFTKNIQSGFVVYHDGKEIFRYYYDKKEYLVKDFNQTIEITEEETFTTVKIFFNDYKTDFNLLLVDDKNKSVVMKDSTCSKSKDCTYTPEIKDKGAIICAPHKLKITSINGNVALVTG